MGILKYLNFLFCIILFISCNEYHNENHSFNTILLRKQNSIECPQKIITEKYLKNSNFEHIIQKDSAFNIICDSINNQVIFSPNTPYVGEINYDIKIIIDDNLKYEITDIKSKVDTTLYTFTLGRKYYINYIFNSMSINGHKANSENNQANIIIYGNQAQK